MVDVRAPVADRDRVNRPPVWTELAQLGGHLALTVGSESPGSLVGSSVQHPVEEAANRTRFAAEQGLFVYGRTGWVESEAKAFSGGGRSR